MSFAAVVTHERAQREHLAVAIKLRGENHPSAFTPICQKVSSLAPWEPVQLLARDREQPRKRMCGDCRRALQLLTRMAREWEEGTGAPPLGTPTPEA